MQTTNAGRDPEAPAPRELRIYREMKIKRQNFWVRRCVNFHNSTLRYYKSQDDKKARLSLDLKNHNVQVQKNNSDNFPLMIISDNKYNIVLRLHFNSLAEFEDIVPRLREHVPQIKVIDLTRGKRGSQLEPKSQTSPMKGFVKSNTLGPSGHVGVIGARQGIDIERSDISVITETQDDTFMVQNPNEAFEGDDLGLPVQTNGSDSFIGELGEINSLGDLSEGRGGRGGGGNGLMGCDQAGRSEMNNLAGF